MALIFFLMTKVAVVASAEAAVSATVLASPDGCEKTLIGCSSTHLIVNQMDSTTKPDLTPAEVADVNYL